MTDAHVHPADLSLLFPQAEAERRSLNIACAASAWSSPECERNEALAAKARDEGAAPVFCCFALHPQLPSALRRETPGADNPASFSFDDELEKIRVKARGGVISAIGETGFDLYNAAFKETENEQQNLFERHLEIAVSCQLPLVLHVRKAMHKIFAYTRQLKKAPAVVFHSWSGTYDDGVSLVKRGINAYYSFGTAILLNHRRARECCGAFPAARLLVESDAPYQPPRAREYASYRDCPHIMDGMYNLRRENGEKRDELEKIVDENFYRVFNGSVNLFENRQKTEGAGNF
ncbi:MAG: TatD family hydrolase [Treponema sp.]|jgi:TatD DNase family protein|nr:TatD family hydrolase [Treponema sp.]